MRNKRPEIKALTTARLRIELDKGQVFYSTQKAFEIWQEKPLRHIKRIPKKRVFWVHEH